MNTAIEEMLKKYNTVTQEEKKNAMKEIMQEIALCGLSRAGFFKKAAFYGGTALRIFYELDRFSEELDFSLLAEDLNFDFSSFFPMLEKEVAAYGLKLSISEKEKTSESNIKSAFLKGNTKEHILLFYADQKLANAITANETIRIKFEVDVNPSAGAGYEHKFQLLPAPYEIRLYDMPSLFAGKIHAVICRAWESRIKGRDLYDYIFYLSRNARVNMPHLKARLVGSGVLSDTDSFNIDILKELLYDRFVSIDYDSTKADVRGFIKDKDSLNIWHTEFFMQITAGLQGEFFIEIREHILVPLMVRDLSRLASIVSDSSLIERLLMPVVVYPMYPRDI
ncbi:MAG: nucleotidyl transferase AbiEii/AbiGii toxin family protein [Desulfosporosinus sp.]